MACALDAVGGPRRPSKGAAVAVDAGSARARSETWTTGAIGESTPSIAGNGVLRTVAVVGSRATTEDSSSFGEALLPWSWR